MVAALMVAALMAVVLWIIALMADFTGQLMCRHATDN